MILATAPDGKAMGTLIDGLGAGGKLIIVGASADPFSVSSVQLIVKRKRSWAGRPELPWTPRTRSDSRRLMACAR